ncbi:MAG TPA: outer membrane protein assembly factor BamB [Idiomarina baltica]|jgi:outer membrane protein assembly factor BamB|uniref:Outer membrane protein assembly factor BamB n=1 Tax=Idiomarina baltica TaxID=190892 RepID=A0A348WQ30_9GAMM|nr:MULTISPECIES: outer membrane protein assembly factor BamB [Idiomarina]KXS36429.1 MAG: outer membrane bioproteinis protein BamB [Idiomarina sp. T82-3]MEC8925041.1 outer membrane protein assembly factor BamB [Pseudomonadota bacterium]HAR56642.1 outer membrane protein assembly factor BamB [Idiomarina baltica]|tara:strand:- start:3191 stop:4429 length:1239 start_codon:yes stop_codon:yes gene_type:complete
MQSKTAMKSLFRTSLIALAGLSLSACSLFGDDDEEIKVAPLQPVSQQVDTRIKWERSVGDGIGDYFSRLNPTVAYGKVFAADRQGLVKAFDKETGETLWQVNLHSLIEINEGSDDSWFGGLFASPFPARIAGGLVAQYNKLFLGTENGDVVALDTETGKLVWHAEVGNEVTSDPAVGDGMVVVHTTGGKVISLSADTGEQNWTFEYQTPTLTLRGASAPTIVSGGVILGDASGKASVLIGTSGQQAWTQTVGEPTGATELESLADIDANPVVVGGVIYMIAYNGELVALELRSGEVRWKRDYSSYENLLVDTGSIYLTDADSHVFGLDIQGGIEQWSNNELFGRALTGPKKVGNYLALGDFEGYLHILSANSGEIVGRMELGGDGIYAQPVSDGNTLYVQTRDGDLYAIEVN